jgi:hypothetical protein
MSFAYSIRFHLHSFIFIWDFYGTLDLTYGFCTGFRLGSVSLGTRV